MNRLLKKHWPLLGIVFLLIIVAGYMIKSQRFQFKKPSYTDLIPKEGIKLKDLKFSQDSLDNKIKWVLDAKEARFSEGGQLVVFKNFQMHLEPEDKPSIDLKGKRGSYDKRSGEINLYEALEGKTSDGYSIVTENALYSHEAGLLDTDEPVQLEGPFFQIKGKGLNFNIQEEKLIIKGQVVAQIDKEALIL